MTDIAPRDQITAFAAHLRRLADSEDRGALAALRASLHDPFGMAAAACPQVIPFLPAVASTSRDQSFFLVGALFALHPESGGERVSLGHAFRRLNESVEGAGSADNESLRRRFVALLDSEREDLPEHLRHAVALLRAHQQPLDWELLLRDVLAWSDPGRRVQRRLARAFWTPTTQSTSSQGETTR
jgi:CRISPR system Cascade subunit CasB